MRRGFGKWGSRVVSMRSEGKALYDEWRVRRGWRYDVVDL
jgi:hypothetical protein